MTTDEHAQTRLIRHAEQLPDLLGRADRVLDRQERLIAGELAIVSTIPPLVRCGTSLAGRCPPVVLDKKTTKRTVARGEIHRQARSR